MTDLNAQTSELNLDDLFSEIDGLDLAETPTASETPAVPTAEEVTLDELDGLGDLDLDALDLGEVTTEAVVPSEPVEVAAVEELTEAEKVIATTAETELDGLFDENDLDASLLDLDSIALEETAVVEDEKPKAKPKPKPKKSPIAPKLDEEEGESTAEESPAAEKPKKKEKSPSTAPRRTYYNSSKSAVLLDRLGGNADEIVLEFDDVDLPPEELKAKQKAFLSLLNNQPTTTADGTTVQKKVAEKVIILFTMFKQKKGWNEVMYRTFKLLLTDGYIHPKKGGNLYQNLLAKPYSEGTASAQMGQMAQMLPLLRIALPDGKGNLAINENSTIVAQLRSEYFPELSQDQASEA